jgi:hypothetical protein
MGVVHKVAKVGIKIPEVLQLVGGLVVMRHGQGKTKVSLLQVLASLCTVALEATLLTMV